MPPLIISVRQGRTECQAIITKDEEGKLDIDIIFKPKYPIANSVMERMVYAIYNEVKRINNNSNE